MSLVVAPIVEGHGDRDALPVLLRRMNPSIQVRTPVRFPRSKLLQREQLERAALIAASNLVSRGAVLLVIDADDDCAVTLASKLESDLEKILPGHLCRVVVPVREFEAWIVGGTPEFNVVDPDVAGRLKTRIRERFGVYKETVDQPRLIAGADLALLEQRSRSFRRLKKILAEILGDPLVLPTGIVG